MRKRKSLIKAMAAVLFAIVILGIAPTTILAQENRVSVNEQIVQFDQPVRIEQGRILAPIKPIADAIGAEVRWNAETSTTTVIFGNAGVAIATDNPIMVVRNMTSGATENVTLPVMAKSYNGIAFVPLENVATALGLKVQQDAANSITKITTPGFTPPKPVVVPSYYLESEIESASEYDDDYMIRYPKNGSFKMGDKAYFRGISNIAVDTIASRVNGDKVANADHTITYDIAGRGFTRLTGIFGRVSGQTRVGSTITISGDGVLLDGFEVSTNTPVSIDVAIPSKTQQLVITLEYGLGLGDAALSAGASQKSPNNPLPPSGAAYLESDIKRVSQDYMIMYPQYGSFPIGDKSYFRGISNIAVDTIASRVNGDKVANADHTITYDIAGRGFTKLTGIFGRVLKDSKGTTMTVSGDGRFLGGFELNASGKPGSIDVTIPPNIKQIVIRLEYGLGLGDALFSSR